MSENLENIESAAENERRKASTEPGLAGEGGQYVEGDYGDAGVVGTEAEEPVEGDYPEGDYGDAGTVGTAREAETDEERNS
ncbi:hypothetical protein J7E83_11000 [Arthrobacter sp. ISL-48]|uniref:hypothetical protein n=1 Tax=Arthrobacter sp. ISL-48 TaxID=2819110 RepID=UPI001BE8412B|nr:hypothetical protein [Arthrobacter sp. ISL-48]MBT2532638.1 hypothetical protein [Arthrobacter sp. ISL-48]